jgi:hypothetical protein
MSFKLNELQIEVLEHIKEHLENILIKDLDYYLYQNKFRKSIRIRGKNETYFVNYLSESFYNISLLLSFSIHNSSKVYNELIANKNNENLLRNKSFNIIESKDNIINLKKILDTDNFYKSEKKIDNNIIHLSEFFFLFIQSIGIKNGKYNYFYLNKIIKYLPDFIDLFLNNDFEKRSKYEPFILLLNGLKNEIPDLVFFNLNSILADLSFKPN